MEDKRSANRLCPRLERRLTCVRVAGVWNVKVDGRVIRRGTLDDAMDAVGVFFLVQDR